jgi:phenylpyruvate tautomerase PptA (4-oxalocrotonate tautomerase family)
VGRNPQRVGVRQVRVGRCHLVDELSRGELPAGDMSNVDGASNYVRVQVLTNAGALDRAKQLAVVSQFTSMIADAGHDPTLADRTWVLLTEAVPGGWGLAGHANTNDELVTAARDEIARLQAP